MSKKDKYPRPSTCGLAGCSKPANETGFCTRAHAVEQQRRMLGFPCKPDMPTPPNQTAETQAREQAAREYGERTGARS